MTGARATQPIQLKQVTLTTTLTPSLVNIQMSRRWRHPVARARKRQVQLEGARPGFQCRGNVRARVCVGVGGWRGRGRGRLGAKARLLDTDEGVVFWGGIVAEAAKPGTM